MKYTLYFLLFLVIFIPPVVNSEESEIFIETDKKSYEEGETITISGIVNIKIGETPITMQIFNEEKLVQIAQLTVAEDGSFTNSIMAKGPLWKNSGEYTIRTSYGENNISEIIFNYLKNSEIAETEKVFRFDGGESGILEINYKIFDGKIDDIFIEPKILGMVIKIDGEKNGKLIIELPREYIDAKSENSDIDFIIILNNRQINYEEVNIAEKSRSIKIDFEEGKNTIEVIGTKVIPEFGQIALLILTSGIILSLVAVRSKMKIIYS